MRKKVERYNVEICRDSESGEVTSEMWFDAATGLPHRTDGPAKTIYVEHRGLRKRAEFYFESGLDHRSGDEPALISTVIDTGIQVQRTWVRKGEYHRDNDLPAIIYRDPDTGAITQEEYYVDGKRHRENGPAVISYDGITGLAKEERYFLGGEQIEDPKDENSSLDPQP